MGRQLGAARFLPFLVLSTLVVQGQVFLQEKSCGVCSSLNTTKIQETNGDTQGEYLIQNHDTAGLVLGPFLIKSNTSFKDAELKPQDDYEITVRRKTGELYSIKISGLQVGPGKVRNLHLKSVSDTKAELHWDPPLHRSGAIVQYSVSLKRNKLLGCEKLERPTPPQDDLLQIVTKTTVSFIDLHPYATYTATVIACTSVPGLPQVIDFQTNQSSIPTSVVSNLRLNTIQNLLTWDRPAVDCTTITGSTLGVRVPLTFTKTMNNWTSCDDTYFTHLNLSKHQLVPYEWYKARVHVIRGYGLPENRTSYQELIWRTLPAAPPAVRLLEIYDMDFDKNTVSLRLLPPVPANGEIESYYVSIMTEETFLTNWSIPVSEGLKCGQWENYVCLKNLILPSNDTASQYRVEVYAINKDVATPGVPETIVFTPDSLYNKKPSVPRNLTAIVQQNGKVTLKWAHSSMTFTKLTHYRMQFDIIDSDLDLEEARQFSVSIEYRVDSENREYTVEMLLPSSTSCRIFVMAVNRQNLSSARAEVEVIVPSSFAVTAVNISPP